MRYIIRFEKGEIFIGLRDKLEISNASFDEYFDNLAELFVDNLSEILKIAFLKDLPELEIKIINHDEISERRRDLYDHAGNEILSLDPFEKDENAFIFGASRHFDQHGNNRIEVGPRPGFEPIDTQIKAFIKHFLKNTKDVTIIDDDIYTGSTMKLFIEKLRESGVRVKQLIAGLDINLDKGIDVPVKSAFKYNPEEVFDMLDPRDYFFGSREGGLVIRQNDKIYRVPYVWPFVDPTARASVPEESAHTFSQSVIKLNQKMYEKLENDLNLEVRLEHLWPPFVEYLIDEFEESKDTRILNFLTKLIV